jgi:antitoxin (DNA-binding transcriptional repressor) of toxin-antitoxin stability system
MRLTEVKSNFFRAMEAVEKNRATVTIMRYGHPVAQIVPIERHNRTKPDPLLSQISYTGDLCSNEADDWEAVHK